MVKYKGYWIDFLLISWFIALPGSEIDFLCPINENEHQFPKIYYAHFGELAACCQNLRLGWCEREKLVRLHLQK